MLTTTTDITIDFDRECKACKGKCVQKRKDGIKIECPSCEGTGRILLPQTYTPFELTKWADYPTHYPLDFRIEQPWIISGANPLINGVAYSTATV